MAGLIEVRGRIQSVSSTQQITKAMKMVAAAKLRRSQDAIIQMRPYAQKLSSILNRISSSVDTDSDNPYAAKRDVQKVLLVVVTSDRGLCGAFNSNIIRETNRLLREEYKMPASGGNVTLMTIGKKGYDYFSKRGMKLNDEFRGLFRHLNFGDARPAAEHALEGFVSGLYDEVVLVYNEFKNVATQILRTDKLLPIGSVVEQGNNRQAEQEADYIFEPSKEYIFKELIPKTLKIQFYKSLLESVASENGARMTAMDKATENAGELLKELRLTYNRTRQAAITKEILEIVGGAEALSSAR